MPLTDAMQNRITREMHLQTFCASDEDTPASMIVQSVAMYASYRWCLRVLTKYASPEPGNKSYNLAATGNETRVLKAHKPAWVITWAINIQRCVRQWQ